MLFQYQQRTLKCIVAAETEHSKSSHQLAVFCLRSLCHIFSLNDEWPALLLHVGGTRQWSKTYMCRWTPWTHNMYIPMSDVNVGPQDSVKLKLLRDSYRTRNSPALVCLENDKWVLYLNLALPSDHPNIFHSAHPVTKDKLSSVQIGTIRSFWNPGQWLHGFRLVSAIQGVNLWSTK